MTLESSTSSTTEVVSTNGGKTAFVAKRSSEKRRKQDANVLERSWTIIDVISNEAGEEIDRRRFDVWGAPPDPKWEGFSFANPVEA